MTNQSKLFSGYEWFWFYESEGSSVYCRWLILWGLWLAHQALIGWFLGSFRKEVCLFTFISWFICFGACYILFVSGLLTLGGLLVSFYVGTKVWLIDIFMKSSVCWCKLLITNVMHSLCFTSLMLSKGRTRVDDMKVCSCTCFLGPNRTNWDPNISWAT